MQKLYTKQKKITYTITVLQVTNHIKSRNIDIKS